MVVVKNDMFRWRGLTWHWDLNRIKERRKAQTGRRRVTRKRDLTLGWRVEGLLLLADSQTALEPALTGSSERQVAILEVLIFAARLQSDANIGVLG
jgi:hypothetical protein